MSPLRRTAYTFARATMMIATRSYPRLRNLINGGDRRNSAMEARCRCCWTINQSFTRTTTSTSGNRRGYASGTRERGPPASTAEFEKPSILKEFNRAKRLPPGTGVRILTLFSYGLTAGLAVYCTLYLSYRGDEQHCFTDMRRWFVKRKAEFLGIDSDIIEKYDEKITKSGRER